MRIKNLMAVVVFGAIGCTKEAPAPAAPVPAAVPMAAPMAPAAERSALTGAVLETQSAPGYTYLRLRTASGEQWAAIPTAAIPVGATVQLADPAPMQNFVSKTLNRTFPEIFFCSGATVVGGAPVAAVAPVAKAPADPNHAALLAWAGQGAPIAAVPKAAGPDGKTVAEVYAQRAALTNQTVNVRGKVVKVTKGVMGKNWLHLQDGSGKADSKDHDLVVTTTDAAELGDVVAARGAVHLDKDLGSGYVFPVLVEDAKLSR